MPSPPLRCASGARRTRVVDERGQSASGRTKSGISHAPVARICCATALDDPEVEIDEHVERVERNGHRPANALLSVSVGNASGGVAISSGDMPNRSASGCNAARSKP